MLAVCKPESSPTHSSSSRSPAHFWLLFFLWITPVDVSLLPSCGDLCVSVSRIIAEATPCQRPPHERGCVSCRPWHMTRRRRCRASRPHSRTLGRRGHSKSTCTRTAHPLKTHASAQVRINFDSNRSLARSTTSVVPFHPALLPKRHADTFIYIFTSYTHSYRYIQRHTQTERSFSACRSCAFYSVAAVVVIPPSPPPAI